MRKKGKYWHAIYRLTDRENGKSNIGRSKEDRLQRRFYEYNILKGDVHVNERLAEIRKREGRCVSLFEAFDCRQIRRIYGTGKEAAIYEKFLAKTYNTIYPNGYNTPKFDSEFCSHDETSKEKIRNSTIKQFSNPSARERNRQTMKEKWKDPEYRKRQHESRKGNQNVKEYFSKKENLEKHSESLKQAWQRPETRAKHIKALMGNTNRKGTGKTSAEKKLV